MPDKVLFVVSVSVDPEIENDWNAWYDEEHLPEILSCPGFLNGARYLASAGPERRYLTVYEIASPAAVETPEFAARRGWGRFAPRLRATVGVFEPVGKAGGP